MPTFGKKVAPLKKEYLKKFHAAYTKLNAEQKKAADTIEGPVIVLAGPGTGKTQVLAMRAANILLTTDAAPHNILALTFTESAVKAMRERLISIIGEDAYYINITTFHAFCSDVIQSFPEYFPFSRQAEPLSDLERYLIVESIIDDQPFQFIKPINSPSFYVKDCIRTIQDLKREGVSPDDFRKLIEKQSESLESDEFTPAQKKNEERSVEKNRELLQVYMLYQKALQDRGRYDYEDMITFVCDAFSKHETLLQTYQERVLYMLVDEFQDTNAAQNKVLELISSFWADEANLFVVGDGDQSLYRFQGASIENSLGFVKKYPNAVRISLQKNYRSTQNILDAAAELIQKNSLSNATVMSVGTRKKIKREALTSINESVGLPIEVVPCSSEPTETLYVIEQIARLIFEGVPAQEIAILYRNNMDSAAFEDALTKWGIPFEIDSGVNVLDTTVVQQLLKLFQVIRNMRTREEDLDLFTVLNYPWVDVDALDILKLSRLASSKRCSLFDLLLTKEYDKQLEQPKKLHAFVEKLVGWSEADASHTFPHWFEIVMNESGLLAYVMSGVSAMEQLNRLQSLFREVKLMASNQRGLNLESFLQSIDIMIEHHIPIHEDDVNITSNAVKLTTAHSAKGLEWSHVFITRAIDGKWGNNVVRNLLKLPEGVLKFVTDKDKEKNEDERRLFYVALTRAKKQVIVTYAKTSITGSRAKDLTRSMFIEELPVKLRVETDVSEFEKNVTPLLQRLLTSPSQPIIGVTEQQWLQGLLDDFVLTPTALNTYLECAYKFKLNVLVKVPRAKQDYLAFGTAVHRALELLFRWILEKDTVPPKEYVIAQFEKALRKEVLTSKDEEARIKQGRVMLSAYYDQYKDEMKKPLFLEKFFGYGGSHIYLDDVRIGGRIDKIEWIDAQAKTIAVVDYKTGSPKSRNEIEGKTVSGNGNYKRQLLFYKLLADLDKTFGMQVTEGVFDFIEQEKSGKFKKESFVLMKEELDELRTVIKDVMKEVRAFHFPRTKNTSICERCDFLLHCWPDGVPGTQVEQMRLV